MRLSRRRALPESAARAARQLKQCETAIALLDRVRPANLPAECARLVAAWKSGARPPLELRHAPPAELSDVQRALDEAARNCDARDVEQGLLLERISELRLEAELAEQVGKPAFRALAGRRFELPESHTELLQTARSLLVSRPTPVAAEPTHLSDDQRDPDSLLSQISRRVFAERLPVRVEVDPGLVALAAVADGVVRVRGGARLTANVGRRIALHEVEGHLLPRVSGAELGGVFLAGSARASEDEEGRAILLEERAGLLDDVRRAELGRRYLAATSVREGAEFSDTVDLLLETGADITAAIELGCRVHRGGGLGRELVYLAGYQRVAAAFTERPELELLQRRGRVSLAAAAALLAASIELDDDRDVI